MHADGSPFELDERMSVIGTEGFIHIQDTFPNIGICTKEGFRSPDTDLLPELHGITGGALHEEWSYFARCVREGTRPALITPEEAMEVVRTVLAAHESATSGTVVSWSDARAAPPRLTTRRVPCRVPDRFRHRFPQSGSRR